jgi:hypothetical protein
MPTKSRNRKILLVGSVPRANAKEVFSESAARLGELIPRIPGRDRRSHHVDPLPKGGDGKDQKSKNAPPI